MVSLTKDYHQRVRYLQYTCMYVCVYDVGCLPLGSPYCLVVFCTARRALVLYWRFALYKCFIIIITIIIIIIIIILTIFVRVTSVLE